MSKQRYMVGGKCHYEALLQKHSLALAIAKGRMGEGRKKIGPCFF
jgi:hypothetical protein